MKGSRAPSQWFGSPCVFSSVRLIVTLCGLGGRREGLHDQRPGAPKMQTNVKWDLNTWLLSVPLLPHPRSSFLSPSFPSLPFFPSPSSLPGFRESQEIINFNISAPTPGLAHILIWRNSESPFWMLGADHRRTPQDVPTDFTVCPQLWTAGH